MNNRVKTMIIIIPVVLVIFGSMAATASATQYSLTLIGPQTTAAGKTFFISGAYTEDGVGKAGISVDIFDVTSDSICSACHSNTGNKIGSAITGEGGLYSTTVGPLSDGDYVFSALVIGSGTTHPGVQSDPLNVHVFSSSITLAGPETATATKNFTINGTLSAGTTGIADATITLQRSIDNAIWSNVTTNQTNITGGYQFSNNKSAAGTYYYRTAYDGNDTYSNATSNVVEVTVFSVAPPQNVRFTSDGDCGKSIEVGASAQVSAAWDGSTDPDLAGYRCHWHVVPPSGESTSATIDVGPYTSTTFSFTPTVAGLYLIELNCTPYTTAGVEGVASNTAACSINANAPPPNQAPTAEAGPDQPAAHIGAQVTLQGSGTDPDNNLPLTYEWSIKSTPDGSTITFAGSDTATPSFTPDKLGDYVFELNVTDSLGAQSSPDTVKVTVVNTPPLADAGKDQTVNVGTLVTLDGTASHDPDNNPPLTYEWSITTAPTDSAAQLSSATADKPTFTPDKAGDYTVELIVTDSLGAKSTADTVKVTANVVNTAPIANAGPDQTVTINTKVTLDGTASSDPDGNTPLTYAWSIQSAPAESTAKLSDTAAAQPIFTPDKTGEYVLTLSVSDSLGLTCTTPDTVKITANPPANQPPTAKAGPDQTAIVRSTVTLNGRGSSDPDGNKLTYAWSIISKPTLSKATLKNPTSARPTLGPDRVGTYVIQLIVNDGKIKSAPDTVTVTVKPTKTTVVQDIQGLQATISKLDKSNFRDKNSQKTLNNYLNAVSKDVKAGKYTSAINTLQKDVLTKTDGCANAGKPDNNDLIVKCPAQATVYAELNYIVQELKTLQGS